MYVVDKKRLTTILGFLAGLTLIIGYLTGVAITKTGGPTTQEDFMKSATEIERFINEEVYKNNDLKEIFKQAKKMGKKNGLIVAFIVNEREPIKVNIMIDLGNKYPQIKSFEVQE